MSVDVEKLTAEHIAFHLQPQFKKVDFGWAGACPKCGEPVLMEEDIAGRPIFTCDGGCADDTVRSKIVQEMERAEQMRAAMSEPGAGWQINAKADRGFLSEDALALLFVEKHGENLHYVAAWGRWLVWDGKRWLPDSTLHVFDLVRETCREALGRKRLDAKTVAAVEKLAKADRRVAATVDQWDVDPWLLNTPDGMVDLRTGDTRAHRRNDYCTKLTAVAPGGDCPLWLAFLERIFAGDHELIAYMQRVCGYSLTGITREHALFFGYGTGGNGKGVFIGTVSGVMGDYATTAPMDTFIASNNDRHPTELAFLRGARLVTASETEEGRRWNETRIKSLTGGDRISARYMRQDFFQFTPAFKLLAFGNHKPGLRGVDEAIRRRFNLIPFTVTITEEQKDEQLPEKLRAEWPGILQWMVDGCGEWQGEGLAPSKAVREATDAYLVSEDSLAQWISECCNVGPNFYATTADLFSSYKKWMDAAGEAVGSQKSFSQKLEKRATPHRQGGTGRTGFRGIGLKPVYADCQ
jgi:putative DNA primase/helicase